MPVPTLSILIVDDHAVVRLGLRRMLGQEFREPVFGEARTAAEALAALAKRSWSLVVLDISLADTEGFDLLQEIRRLYPDRKVVMFSVHFEPEYATHAKRLGAAGFVSKSASRADLIKAVRRVLDGGTYFCSPVSVQPAPVEPPVLSDREHRVLLAIAAGHHISAIAADMTLSIKTVSTYKRRIFNKLGLASTADLVRYVIDHHLA
jgi:DNA-binding NarL/FixJ family response regulator